MKVRSDFGRADTTGGFESRFFEALGAGFRAAERPADYDIESADGQSVVELKLSLQGARDLAAACMRLAVLLSNRGDRPRAVLVARLPRMSVRRVQEEWLALQRTLKPDLMRRMAIVALAADGEITLPSRDPLLTRLLQAATDVSTTATPVTVDQPRTQWSVKSFEAWKVLLCAWLRGEGFLPIQEIARRSGCSLPTLRHTLTRLRHRGEIASASNRSVALSELPRRSLSEVLVLADDLRGTVRFRDASGRTPDPVALLRRIQSKAPEGIALGGVAAAREYVPTFDLNGLPRVDVTLRGYDSWDWINLLDPGLRQLGSDQAVPVLAVHRLRRPEPGFERRKGQKVPLADPAETLLDLYEMRLDDQAEDYVKSLRERNAVRHA
jgi:hypothetical protein